MAQVMLHMSMSLDGFVAGPNVGVDLPMGAGGTRLHDWLFNRSSARSGTSSHEPASEVDTTVMQETFAATGAVILGKRTFDVGVGQWGDTPYPVPSFVLTHTPRAPLIMTSATFTFVTEGVERALALAKAAAGDRDINLMGADIAQQYLKAGLVDEIEINLVPILLCAGLRLFDQIGNAPIELESTRVLKSTGVTHLRYRVIK